MSAKEIQAKGCTVTNSTDSKAILIDVKFDADIRAAFIPPPGYKWCKADYSQIEYRVMASLSQEKSMIREFNAGTDFHIQTAAIMLGKDISEVTKEDRQLGKILNFGITYGMTAYTLAKKTGMSEAEAEEKYKEYFEKVPMLSQLIANAKAFARNYGYTKTFFNRRRYLRTKGLPPQIVGKILRKSFNTLIQGSAADILKIAMVRVATRIKQFGNDCKMLLTVHDELDFIIKEERLDEILAVIKLAMELETPDNWAKIVVDMEVGDSWSQFALKPYIVKNPLPKEPFIGWKGMLERG